MRQPRYLVRFDDICPTMNWTIWSRVTEVLNQHNVRPILAVVPDNQDPQLAIEASRSDFWESVRRWQQSGWTVALHGYQHKYETTNSGMMRIKDASEFAGLPEAAQTRKIDAALEIFRRERVTPEAWIAPGHSFDEVTLSVLRRRGINVIVDGFTRTPFVAANGMTWVPQQLWDFHPVSDGVWTVCYHHNVWGETEFAKFRKNISAYLPQITTLPEVVDQARRKGPTLADSAFDFSWRLARWSRVRLVRGLFRRLSR